MMPIEDIPQSLKDRYAEFGCDPNQYSYAEWCAIYPLTLEKD